MRLRRFIFNVNKREILFVSFKWSTTLEIKLHLSIDFLCRARNHFKTRTLAFQIERKNVRFPVDLP